MFHNHNVRMTVVLGVMALLFAACSPATTSPTSVPSTATVATVATTASTTAATTAATAKVATAASSEPTVASTEAASSNISATSAATEVASNTDATATCPLLNLNTLTGDQLMVGIPGFTNRMVREFQEYRPYVSITQFRKEIGKYVDAAQVTEWEKYVFVPVDPNNADAETLKQIPGVTDEITAQLVSARPFASNQAFVDALGKSLTANQAVAASCYVSAQ